MEQIPLVHGILFKKKTLIYFNWRVITPQHCDGLCHTSIWISHRHTRVPSLLNPPPTSLPTPSWASGCHKALVFGFVWHTTPTGYLLHIWQYICFNAILSNHPTLSFLHCIQESVLNVCVSFAALHIESSELSLQIPYICINIQAMGKKHAVFFFLSTRRYKSDELSRKPASHKHRWKGI